MVLEKSYYASRCEVHVDVIESRSSGEARHGHDVSADRINVTGANGYFHVADFDGESGRNTLTQYKKIRLFDFMIVQVYRSRDQTYYNINLVPCNCTVLSCNVTYI